MYLHVCTIYYLQASPSLAEPRWQCGNQGLHACFCYGTGRGHAPRGHPNRARLGNDTAENGCMCMAIPGSLLKEPGQQTNPSVPLSFLGVTWMKFDSCTNFAHCGFMVPCIELCQAATCPIGKGVAACGPSSGSVEGGRGSPRETPRPLWDQRIAGKPESQGIEKANFAKEAESRNYVEIASKLRRKPPS